MGGQKFRIARQIPEMLIEESGSSPTGARVGRSQRRSQQFASCRRSILPAREHHAERIRRTGLHHLGGIAEALDQHLHSARISHVSQRARRSFAG